MISQRRVSPDQRAVQPVGELIHSLRVGPDPHERRRGVVVERQGPTWFIARRTDACGGKNEDDGGCTAGEFHRVGVVDTSSPRTTLAT